MQHSFVQKELNVTVKQLLQMLVITQNLLQSSMIAIVVLCPKMKAPTTMVMTPHTVKITLKLMKKKWRSRERKTLGYSFFYFNV